ncbi:hypothetical protein [Vibrio panuliri]|nr:hypothetical protein [Vibrio panuliri]
MSSLHAQYWPKHAVCVSVIEPTRTLWWSVLVIGFLPIAIFNLAGRKYE